MSPHDLTGISEYLIQPSFLTILRLISSNVATLREMTSNFRKLDKFEGVGFRWWQKKMHFLLTTSKAVYVLNILNSMSDTLFNVYQSMESAKELWEALENKYISEDASSKNSVVSQFNNYKMVEEGLVLDQLHEIQRILSHFKQHNMHMDESL